MGSRVIGIRQVSSLGAVVWCLGMAVAGPGAATAATITPDILTDEYDPSADTECSLREAVKSAEQNSNFGGCEATDLPYNAVGYGPDTIALGDGTFSLSLPPGNPTPLASGDLNIPSGQQLEIEHPGAGQAAIDGGHLDRVFYVEGTLAVSGVTIQNGTAPSAGGGAIRNLGSLSLTNVALTGNLAAAAGGGGAIANVAGGATLTNVTVSGNDAQGSGGGIHATGMAATGLSNVTVTDNTADVDATGGGDGGGIKNESTAAPAIENTIIAGNDDASPAGTDHPDCSDTMTSGDYNLVGIDSTCFPLGLGMNDQIGTAAGLDPLADNGGPSLTHALDATSMAIDVIPFGAPPSAPCTLTSDQRGYPRPFPTGGMCDIGAYERFDCSDGSPLNASGAFPGEAGCPPPPTLPPATTLIPTPAAAAPLAAKKRCKKGFRPKRVRGKRKCVRKK